MDDHLLLDAGRVTGTETGLTGEIEVSLDPSVSVSLTESRRAMLSALFTHREGNTPCIRTHAHHAHAHTPRTTMVKPSDLPAASEQRQSSGPRCRPHTRATATLWAQELSTLPSTLPSTLLSTQPGSWSLPEAPAQTPAPLRFDLSGLVGVAPGGGLHPQGQHPQGQPPPKQQLARGASWMQQLAQAFSLKAAEQGDKQGGRGGLAYMPPPPATATAGKVSFGEAVLSFAQVAAGGTAPAAASAEHEVAGDADTWTVKP